MRPLATHRHRASWLMLLVLVPLALGAGRANAQVDPAWDHYKVYLTPPFPVPPLGLPVILSDQFGTYTHTVEQLERFMNPTVKQLPPPGGTFGITNPDLHYSWWRITPQPFSAVVTAINQFGDHTLNVHDAVYLLNPARKNQPGEPPLGNHYKCYHCDGPAIFRDVALTDQFGQWVTQVTFPRFFCNPVEKQVQGQPPHQILDPNQHYICYEFQPEDPGTFTATMTDQFLVNHPMELSHSRFLCVPTYKSGVTDAVRDTWGKLKQLYR